MSEPQGRGESTGAGTVLAWVALAVCRARGGGGGGRAMCLHRGCPRCKGTQDCLEDQLCARKITQPVFGEHQVLAGHWVIRVLI